VKATAEERPTVGRKPANGWVSVESVDCHQCVMPHSNAFSPNLLVQRKSMFLSGEICAGQRVSHLEDFKLTRIESQAEPRKRNWAALKSADAVVLHFPYQWKQEWPNNEDKQEPSSDLTRGNPLMSGKPHLYASLSRGVRNHEDHRFISPYGWCRVSIA